MFEAKSARWRKLDNAAKIFPATSGKNDTRVFRFYCILKAEIEENSLTRALERTIEKYPVFLSVMRKGLFWHYLEASSLKPIVQKEQNEPCRNIYVRDKKCLLFEVTYFKNRINFEVFHALTDGTGAMEFLRELVKNYLLESHKEDNLCDIPLVDETITVKDQEVDSFTKYYSSEKRKNTKHKIKAFQIKRTLRDKKKLQITEGILSANQVLEKAREYGVSMTVLLTTVLLCAIHAEMSRYQERKPVVLMVPVNLRKFFKSESMLNFFGWIEPGYLFQNGNDKFEEVLSHVKAFFAHELTAEQIAEHMNGLIALERHPILRFAPLELKNICMLAGAKFAEKEVTAVFSNMGVVSMPDAYESYIERFGVYTSTPKVELCMCSFGDTLSLGFTSRLDSLNIQRNFFQILTKIGVSFEIQQPEQPKKKKETYPGLQFFRWFSFCCIALAVISVVVNISVTPELYWSVIVAFGIVSMWLALAIGFFKRHNLLKNAMWQLLVITIGCIIWDAFTGWYKWSVNYVFPSVVIVILVSMWIITKIQMLTAKDYMIYYLMAIAYGFVLSSIFLLFHVATVGFPSAICAGFSFLTFIALVIFKHNDFKEELHKNFHI